MSSAREPAAHTACSVHKRATASVFLRFSSFRSSHQLLGTSCFVERYVCQPADRAFQLCALSFQLSGVAARRRIVRVGSWTIVYLEPLLLIMQVFDRVNVRNLV